MEGSQAHFTVPGHTAACFCTQEDPLYVRNCVEIDAIANSTFLASLQSQALMSLDSRRSEQLRVKASEAEELLVFRRFQEAERASLELLQNAVYLPRSRFEHQRAACVYLQAMYEQQR